MPLDVLEDVEERRRRGRLVAVHLRPQQHAGRPRANRDVMDRPPLERLADLLEREQPRRRGHDLVQPLARPLHDRAAAAMAATHVRCPKSAPARGDGMDASCARVTGLARDSVSTRLRQKVNANRVKCMGPCRDSGPGTRAPGRTRPGSETWTGRRGPNRQLRTLRATEYRTIRAGELWLRTWNPPPQH